MVKAELSYNPYLLETNVKFNGELPKINSLVEKHLAGALQKWVARIPAIFYDEMNGYGFDLEFTGTTADFETLQATFDAQRISRDSVRLFHKNELEDACRKSERLSSLLEWLRGNPNRRFDYPAFRSAHADLFDADYSLVIVQGEQHEAPFPDVVVEHVSGAEELVQTDLENTPILFCVDEQNRAALARNLNAIISRDDVVAEQLFFLIGHFPDRFRVERSIADSGIGESQIVSGPDDVRIQRFIALYPMTEFIRRAITVFRRQEKTLQDILQAENQRSIQTNSDLHEIIDALDTCINLLKAAHERILQRDNYRSPDALGTAKKDCQARLQNWRRKKVKMTDDDEATREADAFAGEAGAAFAAFIAQAQNIFHAEAEGIRAALAASYASAEYDDEYTTPEGSEIDLTGFNIPELTPGLLSLFEEHYTDPKNPADFLGGILKNIPAVAQAKPKGPVRSVTYLYSDWRQCATEALAPVMDEVIEHTFATLADYYMRAAEDYLRHLESLEQMQLNARYSTAARLTSDEQALQADNMWFATFQEKLREIERD